MSGFFGSAPGQDLSEIVELLNTNELRVIVGDDTAALVKEVSDSDDHDSLLREMADNILKDQADVLLRQENIRGICFDAMNTDKQAELADRLGIHDVNLVQSTNPTTNTVTWRHYLEFFGVDQRGATPFSVEPEKDVVRPQYGLFPHQRGVVNRVFHAIRGGHGRVVLHMPTGAGKTRTAMHIVSRILAMNEPSVVVWLAASRELLDQAVDAFQHTWSFVGNRDVEIVRFWGEYSPDLETISDGLIVAGLQKLHAFKSRNPIALLRIANSVKLVIIDEAHQAVAPTYRDLIDALSDTGPNDALLGLTATPGRSWSNIADDEHLSSFFRENKVMLEAEGWDNPVSFLIENGYLAKPTYTRLEVPLCKEMEELVNDQRSHDDYDPVILETLGNQTIRNVAIISEIRRLISVGHNRVIVFSPSVRHAEVIAATLSALGIGGRSVTAKSGSATRTRVIREFRGTSPKPLVICNFGVLTTGFDAPNTSATIIARPTKSLVLYSQMVGRATRGPKAGGNENCEISTVVDIGLPGFGDLAEAFSNWEDVWNESVRYD